MLPDVFTEHLAHGAPPLDSREAEAPMTVDPTGIAGPAPDSRGTEHLTDLPIKKTHQVLKTSPVVVYLMQECYRVIDHLGKTAKRNFRS